MYSYISSSKSWFFLIVSFFKSKIILHLLKIILIVNFGLSPKLFFTNSGKSSLMPFTAKSNFVDLCVIYAIAAIPIAINIFFPSFISPPPKIFFNQTLRNKMPIMVSIYFIRLCKKLIIRSNS